MDGQDASSRPAADQAASPGRASGRWLPNALTVARFAAIPAFVAAMLGGNRTAAFAWFVAAAATDYLDGLAARWLGHRTRFGSIADPLADKLLMLAALGLLVRASSLPLWLLVLLLVRDVGMLTAWVAARLGARTFEPEPVRLGKYATFLVMGLVAWTLARPEDLRWRAVLLLTATECIVLSSVQYFTRWMRSVRPQGPKHLKLSGRSRSRRPPPIRPRGRPTSGAPTSRGPS